MRHQAKLPRLIAMTIGFFLFAPWLAFAGTTAIATNSVSTIVGVNAGLCLGIKDSSSAAQATLQSQTCTGSDFQKWKFIKDSAGYFTLVNVGSGLCINVPGATTTQGTNIIQEKCGDADSQKWDITDQGSGQYSIISKASSLALDVYGTHKANGTRVIQWSWGGGTNQKWFISTEAGTSGAIGFGAGTTGGAGGDVVTVTTPDQLASALCATTLNGSCSDTTPRIIRVSGMLDFRSTEGTKTELGCTYSANNCSVNGKSERILSYSDYCSGKTTYNITYDAAGKTPLLVGSNKTLIGVGANSGIKGKGLRLKNGVKNIIIRNLSITDINDGVIWGGDAITIDNASKVWIDHNYLTRIGRQMIVTGWNTAQNVTISSNYFDGSTEYAHWCNGKGYWIMLFLGENQTITLYGNRIHNTSGRSPNVGKRSTAASGGIVHLVNNYYDGNYYTGGLTGNDDVATLVEGNYFTEGDNYFPIYPNTTNKVFALIESNIATANNSCISILGRDCMINNDENARTENFTLVSATLSTIQEYGSSAIQAIKSVIPAAPSSVPNLKFGPQADITE